MLQFKGLILVVMILPGKFIYLFGQPQERNSASILYHPEFKEVMVYGGSAHSRSSIKMRDSIVWMWNGLRWKPYTTAPSIRSGAVLTYQAATRKLVLIGGSFSYSREKSIRYTDTWEFDGTNWRQVSDATLPNHLFHTAGSYHPEERTVLLFGGFDPNAEQLSNRTWIYDNTIWTVKSTQKNPAPRNLHCMFMDSQNNGVIVVGGDNMTPDGLRDMWIYRHGEWELIANNLPFKLIGQYCGTAIGMSGDYFFLRSSFHENISEAWLWKGSSKQWKKLTATPPGPRNDPAIVYDEFRNRIVVFGGEIGIESTNEVWEFDLSSQRWAKVFPQ